MTIFWNLFSEVFTPILTPKQLWWGSHLYIPSLISLEHQQLFIYTVSPVNVCTMLYFFLQLTLFSHLSWDKIDISHCVHLTYTIQWFDICMYCKMITTIMLVNTSFASYNYHFVVVIMRKLKISHSNIQVYNTVLLTTDTTLYLKPPELTYHITETLYLLTYIFLFLL